jgi:hypothetical protein
VVTSACEPACSLAVTETTDARDIASETAGSGPRRGAP